MKKFKEAVNEAVNKTPEDIMDALMILMMMEGAKIKILDWNNNYDEVELRYPDGEVRWMPLTRAAEVIYQELG